MSSDFGLYGKDGIFDIPKKLTVYKCGQCGLPPKIKCNYDDTSGFRDTGYIIFCECCKFSTRETSILENSVKDWNKRMKKFNSQNEYLRRVVDDLISANSNLYFVDDKIKDKFCPKLVELIREIESEYSD